MPTKPREMGQTTIARSDANARLLLDVMMRTAPEAASELGASEADERVADLRLTPHEVAEAYAAALRELQSRRASEGDASVARDLDVLIDVAGRREAALRAEAETLLPYVDVARIVYDGMRPLLDDRTVAGRRRTAVRRLRAYAGFAPGVTALPIAAERRLRAAFAAGGGTGPYRRKVERDLANAPILFAGVAASFERFAIDGYDVAFGRLREQFAIYEAFVRSEVLPRARDTFALPGDLYRATLRLVGVDDEPSALAARARRAFAGLREQMHDAAGAVARARRWPAAGGYPAAIAALRAEQLEGEAILTEYRTRLDEIDSIIRREQLVSLPNRPAIVRLATAAEAAVVPAPHLRLPRLIENEGEYGEFVLPTVMPASAGAPAQRLTDFTYGALSWPIAAHEARPGHELQLGALVDRSMSLARSALALNSVNAEGWALYAESLIEPYMPVEGKLATLQSRAWRAARAFIDPELHAGSMTEEEATRILTGDVCLTPATAAAELRRYTEIMPGQATAYFFGFEQFRALRADVERALGARFNCRVFHDAVLDEGLVPPSLVRSAVCARLGVA